MFHFFSAPFPSWHMYTGLSAKPSSGSESKATAATTRQHSATSGSFIPVARSPCTKTWGVFALELLRCMEKSTKMASFRLDSAPRTIPGMVLPEAHLAIWVPRYMSNSRINQLLWVSQNIDIETERVSENCTCQKPASICWLTVPEVFRLSKSTQFRSDVQQQ